MLRTIVASGFEWEELSGNVTAISTVAQGPINLNGPLAGEVIAFTGELLIPRREASELAARAGCTVGSGVTKETTLLVVGDQDIYKLVPGQMKSSKHRKAEDLITKGQPIRIIGETDFIELLKLSATM